MGLTISPATYWGVVGVMGVLAPPRWCKNDAQQKRPKKSQSAIHVKARPTDFLLGSLFLLLLRAVQRTPARFWPGGAGPPMGVPCGMPRRASGAAFPLPHLARNSFEAARPEHQFAKERLKRGAGTGCPRGTAFDLSACGAEQIMKKRSKVHLQLSAGPNVRT